MLLYGLYFYARLSRVIPVPSWTGAATGLLVLFAYGVVGCVAPKRGDVLAWAARGLLLAVRLVGGVYLTNGVFFGGPSTPPPLTFFYLPLGLFSVMRQKRLRPRRERNG